MLRVVVHHIGRPVVEYLEPSELYLALLNVYPAVRDYIVDGRGLGLVLDLEPVEQQAYGDEIPVGKLRRDVQYVLRHVRESLHQILDRHRGNKEVAFDGALLAEIRGAAVGAAHGHGSH